LLLKYQDTIRSCNMTDEDLLTLRPVEFIAVLVVSLLVFVIWHCPGKSFLSAGHNVVSGCREDALAS
jgi:hypothetical protein